MEYKVLEEQELELLKDVIEDDDMIFNISDVKKFL